MKKFDMTLLLASLAGVTGATAGCSTTAPEGTAAAEAPPVQPAVPGVLQPRAGLLTSGQLEAGAWQTLAAEGVTTVINLRTDAEMAGRDEAAEVAAAGLRYQHLPVEGGEGLSLEKARALQALLQQADGPVLVHCASGNRVGALLALGAADAGTPVEAAIAQGRAAGMTSTEARVRALLSAPAPASGD